MTARTVLVVDDSPDVRALIAQAFVEVDWTVETAADMAAARKRIAQGSCDVLITGLGTSSAEDLKALRYLRRCHPAVKMIVLTAGDEPEAVIDALRAHAFSYFSRPFSPDEIRAMVERALAEPDWDDGIEVASGKPEWIAVRARCRMLTADRLLRFLEELSVDLPEEDRESTGTAFREILLNAVEHGGRFDPDKHVEITRIRTTGMIMYLVRDPGEGFDFDALPHAAISNPADPVQHVAYRAGHGMRAGGFGLLIVRGFVDELLHNSKGNEALLIKYVK